MNGEVSTLLTQKERIEKKLETVDPLSEEYEILLKRLSEINREIVNESRAKAQEARDEFEMNLRKLESEHKIELERSEFELKADETERTLRMKERETEAKVNEANNKLKNEGAAAIIKEAAKLPLIAGLYLFEAKGLVLPARILQFFNGLGK